jgi:hypothetical protein
MTNSFLTDPNQFQQAQRIARAFSESELVPQHMRGKMADCLVALHIANQMDEDPLQVMQSLYQVGGRPGWITAFMISRANKSGRFMDPIDWEIEGAGKTAKVTAFVQLRRADGTAGRTVRSPMVDMTMAQAEGWTRNKKYETMPELMFRYRAATLLIRLYAPEVLYGYHTVEEIEDISPLKDVTPPKLGVDDFKPGAGRKPSVTIEAEPEPAQAGGPPEAEREGPSAAAAQTPPPADTPSLSELRGIAPNATGGKSAEEYVREDREEWERDPPPDGGEAARGRGGTGKRRVAEDAVDRQSVDHVDLAPTDPSELGRKLTEAARRGVKYFDRFWLYSLSDAERKIAGPTCGQYREIAMKVER